ncbi:MAG: type II toxin-antitoxin system RelE/ParE family toxin [Acidobacteriota bacterium]
MKYRIEYSRDAVEHLRLLTTREQRLVLDRADRMLAHDPAVETRNRKPMRPNPLAPWELRIGSIRVYYDIEEEPECIVVILAVGIKERNRVRIGKEVLEL